MSFIEEKELNSDEVEPTTEPVLLEEEDTQNYSEEETPGKVKNLDKISSYQS